MDQVVSTKVEEPIQTPIKLGADLAEEEATVTNESVVEKKEEVDAKD
jgi:hypothetical protein